MQFLDRANVQRNMQVYQMKWYIAGIKPDKMLVLTYKQGVIIVKECIRNMKRNKT